MDIGEIILSFALVLSILSPCFFILGIYRRDTNMLKVGEGFFYTTSVFLLASLLVLLYYFLSDDFNVLYVYLNSDVYLPTLYKISAVWAGKEGSMLLWIFFISMLSSIYTSIEKRSVELAKQISIISVFIACLLFILLFTSNPFLRINFVPTNGIGLNPLLRVPEMIFHPPIIFLGYAAVTIPFVANLISREVKRSWMLLSWLLLTIGIFLGAWWAYKTLGWGGFWAWDPVENASLLPWVALTAAIHLTRYERENYFFISTAFVLVLFAAFVTRSGIIKSVHAFSQSIQGNAYLILVIAFLLLSIYGFNKNVKTRKNTLNDILNVFILLFVFFIFAVLVGTISSIFTSVNKFYYYSVALPIFGLITALMGACFLKRKRMPIAASLITLSIFLLLKEFVVAIAAAIFAFSSSALVETVLNKNKLKTLSKTMVHLGVIFLFLGSTLVWLDETKYENVKIEEGNAVTFDGFNISYQGAFMKRDSEKFTFIALIKVNGKTTILKQHLYKIERKEKIRNDVSILFHPFYDCYIALKGFSNNFKTIVVDIYIIPLMSFVWIGFYLLMIGGYFALIRK